MRSCAEIKASGGNAGKLCGLSYHIGLKEGMTLSENMEWNYYICSGIRIIKMYTLEDYIIYKYFALME